jgi:hypothetical protein
MGITRAARAPSGGLSLTEQEDRGTVLPDGAVIGQVLLVQDPVAVGARLPAVIDHVEVDGLSRGRSR